MTKVEYLPGDIEAVVQAVRAINPKAARYSEEELGRLIRHYAENDLSETAGYASTLGFVVSTGYKMDHAPGAPLLAKAAVSAYSVLNFLRDLEEKEKHNGWTNRETWLAHLHLSNDQNLTNVCRALVYRAEIEHDEFCRNHPDFEPSDEAIDRMAGDYIRDWLINDWLSNLLSEELNASNFAKSILSDILTQFDYRVNWAEVARAFREE